MRIFSVCKPVMVGRVTGRHAAGKLVSGGVATCGEILATVGADSGSLRQLEIGLTLFGMCVTLFSISQTESK